MPSYAFKRPPTSAADYKVISEGDKYTFFGTTAVSKAMGSVVNYRIAKFIIQQAVSWSNINETDYEQKKNNLKNDLILTPSQRFEFADPELLRYFYYDPFDSGEGTWFAIYIQPKKGVYFSETMNVSDKRQEYNIITNEAEVYVTNLIDFLRNSGAKEFKFDFGEEYNNIRERAYTYSWTEAIGETIPIDKEG